MKKLIIFIVLLPFTFSFADSFKDLWHCKATSFCDSSMKNCTYRNNTSIYFKYIKNRTICHQYKGDKEHCTRIVEEYKDIDSYGREVVIAIGETVVYGVGDNYLHLLYNGYSIGNFECVVEYNVK